MEWVIEWGATWFSPRYGSLQSLYYWIEEVEETCMRFEDDIKLNKTTSIVEDQTYKMFLT